MATPNPNVRAPPSEVDIIVVGGGAAGCIVAGRLAKADPSLQIAIIEAGQDNLEFPTSYQPAMYISHLAPTSTTANFYVANESTATNGRACVVPVGGMLGGGSSINFLMYTRGSASDYDDWKTEGWSFNDLLPLSRKTETLTLADQNPKLHGNSGPLKVSYGGHQSNLATEFIATTPQVIDIPYQADAQDFSTGHAITKWAKWISPTTGRRQDTANGFVHPVMATQTNLHLLTEQKTIRILFSEDDPTKAVGVEYCFNPLAKVALDPTNPPKVEQVCTMKARKLVVISSGAFGTPAILERSGVGAKDILEKAGVDVRVELNGVGATYEDHQLTLATYRVAEESETLDNYLRGVPEVHIKEGTQWATDGQGLVATNAIDCGMKVRPTPEQVEKMGPAFQKVWEEYFVNAPDKPVMFGGCVSSFLGDHGVVPAGKYMMMGAFLTYPLSKGHTHIRSSDPFAAPDFDAAYLAHPADMAPQVWMYKTLREIARRMPSYRGELGGPANPSFAATSSAAIIDMVDGGAAPLSLPIKDIDYSDEDNAAIEDWLRQNVATTWHSMATCPMKPESEGGVVDPRLNVYGTKGLKLADLSICPSNVGGNTYSTAMMVGEKAAMIIAEDLGIANV